MRELVIGVFSPVKRIGIHCRDSSIKFPFKCDRCGAMDEVCENSGFAILNKLIQTGPSWRFDIKKVGATVTVGGKTAAAGTGTAMSDPQFISSAP